MVSKGPKRRGGYTLSFAVLALAVEDMNALDLVITSAKPLAFLHVSRKLVHIRGVGVLESYRPSDPDKAHQSQFLIA